jgi:hypothetical protein
MAGTPVSPFTEIKQIGPRKWAATVSTRRRFKETAPGVFSPIVLRSAENTVGHRFFFDGSLHSFGVDADGWTTFTLPFGGQDRRFRKRLRAIGYVQANGTWRALANTIGGTPTMRLGRVVWPDYFPGVDVTFGYHTSGVASVVRLTQAARLALAENLPAGALWVALLWEYDLSLLRLSLLKSDGGAVNPDNDEADGLTLADGATKVMKVLGGKIRAERYRKGDPPLKRRFLFRRMGGTICGLEAFRLRALTDLAAGAFLLNDTIEVDIVQDVSIGYYLDNGEWWYGHDDGSVLTIGNDYGSWWDSLVQFDLSGIGGPIACTYAEVRAHMWGCHEDLTTAMFAVRRITSAWDESVTVQTRPSLGDVVHATQDWGQTVCEFAQDAYAFELNAAGRSAVEDWVADADTNHGLEFYLDGATGWNENYSASSEGGEVGEPMTLYIEYEPGEPNPVYIGGIVKTKHSQVGILSVMVSNGVNGDETDEQGQYQFEVESGYSGSVSPAKDDWTFTPVSRVYSNLTESVDEQDYEGLTPPAKPTCVVLGKGQTSVVLSDGSDPNANPPTHAFTDADGGAHKSTSWQVRRVSDQVVVCESLHDVANKETVGFAGLVANTDYEARCRWTSEDDEDGEWSNWTPFTTLAAGGAQVKLAVPVDLGNPTLDHYYVLCDGKFA